MPGTLPGVAQLVGCLLWEQEVASSSLATRTSVRTTSLGHPAPRAAPDRPMALFFLFQIEPASLGFDLVFGGLPLHLSSSLHELAASIGMPERFRPAGAGASGAIRRTARPSRKRGRAASSSLATRTSVRTTSLGHPAPRAAPDRPMALFFLFQIEPASLGFDLVFSIHYSFLRQDFLNEYKRLKTEK